MSKVEMTLEEYNRLHEENLKYKQLVRDVFTPEIDVKDLTKRIEDGDCYTLKSSGYVLNSSPYKELILEGMKEHNPLLEELNVEVSLENYVSSLYFGSILKKRG